MTDAQQSIGDPENTKKQVQEVSNSLGKGLILRISVHLYKRAVPPMTYGADSSAYPGTGQ